MADKLVSDFDEEDPKERPTFFFHLGDVIYSFGEAQYYYDQFYEPYRDYPAPILALAGNHDGMVAPGANATTLAAFLENFCAPEFEVTPEAGGLSRTAQIQPGVFFTFEAPFLRILTLYSNTLEDPGVIADPARGQFAARLSEGSAGTREVGWLQGGGDSRASPSCLHRRQQARLERADGFADRCHLQRKPACGRMPCCRRMRTTISASRGCTARRKFPTSSAAMAVTDWRSCCARAQSRSARHGITGTGHADKVTLENYDDQDYGYLRIVVTETQLRIEYHPASDGAGAKTPDDFVTVDIASRKLVHFTG